MGNQRLLDGHASVKGLPLSAFPGKIRQGFPVIDPERNNCIRTAGNCGCLGRTESIRELAEALEDTLNPDIPASGRCHPLGKVRNRGANIAQLFQANVQPYREPAVILGLSQINIPGHNLGAKDSSQFIIDFALVRKNNIDGRTLLAIQ